MANILVLHGPNLNLLGQREQDSYGNMTLTELNRRLDEGAQKIGHHVITAQHNGEAELIAEIHQAHKNDIEFIIINPAAFTHTSIALRDALLAVATPFIEVHISNIYQRENFRHQSYLSDVAKGVITGLGVQGYELALLACTNYLS